MGLSFNEDKNRFNSVVYTRKIWRNWQEEISLSDGAGSWQNFTFEEGVPKLLETPYMDFNKSVLHPGIPMILSNAEVQAMADMPDNSEAANQDAGDSQTDDGGLPF